MASSYGKTLCDHSRKQTTKHPSRHSLLLKDYLRDDLSSCSSNGFKSLPRQQCCTTVGFKLQRKRKNTLLRQPTSFSCSSSKISVLHRASEVVINAIKSLPLSQKSGKDKTKKVGATGFLSRSFSRKLLWSSRRFWRKASAKEEEGSEGNNNSTRRWRRSFRELLMEERDKTTSNEDIIAFTVPSTATSSGCGSKSRGESEFTFSSGVTSSESSAENDVVEGNKEVPPRDKIAGVATKDWPNEEKEQFSPVTPVSILDCPFEDDEEITSHFNSTAAYLLEGDQHKHTQKRRHFKSVATMELVTLEKRIDQWSKLDDETYNHDAKHCSLLVPIMCTQHVTSNMLHDNLVENAGKLPNFVKRSIPSNCLIVKAENPLFDYFKQSIGENNDIDHHSKKLHLCEVAEDWINGQPQELYSGWEVKEGRKVYIREMDREWKNSDQEIRQQLAVELENDVFASLVNELVHDLMMQQVSSIVFSLL